MPTATGTFQFPSVIPGFLFYKEVEEGRDDKDKSNTIDFFLRNGIYMYMFMCVCILCVILSRSQLSSFHQSSQ